MIILSEEKRKYKNLTTYSIVMVLAAILLIIIAAMADGREELFENQIIEQEQANASIQNEIVTLKDENYRLAKELETLKTKSAEQENDLVFYKTLQEVVTLAEQGKTADASAKLATLNTEGLNEEKKLALKTLYEVFNLPAE